MHLTSLLDNQEKHNLIHGQEGINKLMHNISGCWIIQHKEGWSIPGYGKPL